MSGSERELLLEFVGTNSQDAFSALVTRYVDLVYTAALRQVRSPQVAEEITQNTFIALAQNAHRLKPNTPLVAWLFLVTRRGAIDAIRAESRRHAREQIAMEMNATNSDPSGWSQIAPLLDEAIAALKESDRGVILMRFFEGKTLREVGDALGTSEDAAQKRLTRAVSELRSKLSRRGVAVGASSLALSLTAQATQTAPVGLGISISSSAAIASAMVAHGTIGGTGILAMTTIQKIIAGATIVAAVGAGVGEHQTVRQQRDQIAAKEGELELLRVQVRQLIRERDDAKSQWSALQSEIDTAVAAVSRAKGGAVREDSSEVKALLDRAATLKERVAQLPSGWARATNLLTKEDWMSVALGNPLDTQKSIDHALAQLQHKVVGKWAETVQAAALSFAKNSGGFLPTDSSQLATYLPADSDATILQRFELLRMGNVDDLPRDRWLVANIGALDDNSNFVALYGRGNAVIGSDDSGDIRETLRAYLGFVRAHNGQPATELSQLQPYFRRGIDPQRSEEFWRQFAPSLR
jgi:RNA polymerase sigma factor (sigma-70 family)